MQPNEPRSEAAALAACYALLRRVARQRAAATSLEGAQASGKQNRSQADIAGAPAPGAAGLSHHGETQ